MRRHARGEIQRMKRRLTNLLTILSLLLGVAAAWLRSYRTSDALYWVGSQAQPGHDRAMILYSGRGGVLFSVIAHEQAGGFFHDGLWPPPGEWAVRLWSEDDPESVGTTQPSAAFVYRHEGWGFGADRYTTSAAP